VDAEFIVAMPKGVTPVTTVRSTLLHSSRSALTKRGLLERYQLQIEPKYKAAVMETLAPEWLPLEVGLAHYRACDALGLSQAELEEIGAEVGAHLQGTFIGTLLRGARSVGLTPWVPLAQFQRLKERLMQGGGVAVCKVGPKDATIDLRQIELFKHDYFRIAYCGVIASAIKLGAGKSVRVQVVNGGGYDQRCVYKCSWV